MIKFFITSGKDNNVGLSLVWVLGGFTPNKPNRFFGMCLDVSTVVCMKCLPADSIHCILSQRAYWSRTDDKRSLDGLQIWWKGLLCLCLLCGLSVAMIRRFVSPPTNFVDHLLLWREVLCLCLFHAWTVSSCDEKVFVIVFDVSELPEKTRMTRIHLELYLRLQSCYFLLIQPKSDSVLSPSHLWTVDRYDSETLDCGN